jgi:chemotaxis-related protein WspB
MLALVFQVGADRVALDVRRVREVVPRVRLRPLTGGPAWLAGVFVYRGRPVPVIDLHRLVGAGECPAHLSSRIVLVPHPAAGPDALVGLLATQVDDVRTVPEPADTDPLLAAGDAGLGLPVVVGAEVFRVLDPDRLLPTGIPVSRDPESAEGSAREIPKRFDRITG